MKEKKQKIDWYKEVLELEPGSRIFFPLARLQAEEGQLVAAVNTLQQGLAKHPDHVEARLLLVDLLFKHMDTREPQTEVDYLGKLFASYPSFWLAWSSRLASVPAMQDASLAMRFFAAALPGKRIGWGDVIEQGIRSLFSDQGGTQNDVIPAVRVEEELDDDLGEPLVTEKKIAAALSSPYRENLDAAFEENRESRDLRIQPSVPVDAIADEESDDYIKEAPQAVFSVRTRSMAEVLAEQGDANGAIEIYRELMQNASSRDKDAFASRIQELTQYAIDHPSSPVIEDLEEDDALEDEDASDGTSMESTRLVSLLESLAQRLEDRAR